MASQAQASQQKLRDQLKEALDAGAIDLQTYLAQLKALRESVAQLLSLCVELSFGLRRDELKKNEYFSRKFLRKKNGEW